MTDLEKLKALAAADAAARDIYAAADAAVRDIYAATRDAVRNVYAAALAAQEQEQTDD
jgi:hypothetical protein